VVRSSAQWRLLEVRRRVVNAVQSRSGSRALSSLQERLAAGPDLSFFARGGAAQLGLPAESAGRSVWLETCGPPQRAELSSSSACSALNNSRYLLCS